MTALAFLLAYAGFAALALAMDRHHRQVFGRAPRRGIRIVLRIAGAAGLCGALAACVAASGGSIGTVEWFGVLSASALAFVLLFAFRPHIAVAGAGAIPRRRIER